MTEDQLAQLPEDPYSAWEIESTIDELLDRAKEIGKAHSDMMVLAGRGETPRAYRACTSYHAITIIRQLQKEIEELQGSLRLKDEIPE